MALTVGVDTYATLAETLATATRRVVEGAAFVALDDEERQENALQTAREEIEAVPLSGTRLIPSQSLAIPRAGLSQGADEQRDIMRRAQIAYTLYIAPSFQDEATESILNPESIANGNVKKEVVAAIEVEYFAAGISKPGALDRFPPNVRDLLSQLMNQKPVSVYVGQGKARRVS